MKSNINNKLIKDLTKTIKKKVNIFLNTEIKKIDAQKVFCILKK